jgi:hypothetical protein
MVKLEPVSQSQQSHATDRVREERGESESPGSHATEARSGEVRRERRAEETTKVAGVP